MNDWYFSWTLLLFWFYLQINFWVNICSPYLWCLPHMCVCVFVMRGKCFLRNKWESVRVVNFVWHHCNFPIFESIEIATYQSNTVVKKKMVWVVTRGEREGGNIGVWNEGMWTTMHKINENKDILFITGKYNHCYITTLNGI